VRFMRFSASFVSGFDGRNQVQDKARHNEGALRVIHCPEPELGAPVHFAGWPASLVSGGKS